MEYTGGVVAARQSSSRRSSAGLAGTDHAGVPVRLPLASIDPSPRNPRQKLAGLDELSDSLRAYGLLQPIVVRPTGGDRYEIVAGHRRFAAARALGWTELPAVVRHAEQDQAYVLTLVENLQRDDLSPREEARALEVLLREHGWSTRQVAEAIHRSPAYVSKRLRVFEDPVLGELVLARALSVSAAEELLPLKPTLKQALAEQAAREAWDHPRVRAEIRARFDSKRGRGRPRTLRRQTADLRHALQGMFPADLSDAERRELRLLFEDLAVLARAPAQKRRLVFPPLPATSSRSSRHARRR